MGDGLFVVGLGVVLIILGLPAAAIRHFRPDMPKTTGYLRGTEIGSYIGMGLGALLVVAGVGAIVVELLS